MSALMNGKAVLVTGASRGIGRAIAVAFARAGANVAIAARDAAALAETARLANAEMLLHAGDLRAPEAADAFVAAAVAKFGRVDVVVNNAGATKRAPFMQLNDQDFIDGFALKFHNSVRMARAAWPHLKAARGAMINIIGAGGRTAAAEFTIGGSVNAALFNFTKAMAQQGIADGVRVVAISPGSIETDRLTARVTAAAKAHGESEDAARARMLAEHGTARFGRPEEIGAIACWLAGPEADYIQGAIIEVDGGLTRAI